MDMQQATQSEEQGKLNKRYSLKDGENKVRTFYHCLVIYFFKARRRSSSAARIFSGVTNLLSGGRRSSAVGLFQAGTTIHLLEPIPGTPNRICMDPEPSPHTSPSQVNYSLMV